MSIAILVIWNSLIMSRRVFKPCSLCSLNFFSHCGHQQCSDELYLLVPVQLCLPILLIILKDTILIYVIPLVGTSFTGSSFLTQLLCFGTLLCHNQAFLGKACNRTHTHWARLPNFQACFSLHSLLYHQSVFIQCSTRR